MPHGAQIAIQGMLGCTVAGHMDATFDDSHHRDHHSNVLIDEQGLELSDHDCGSKIVDVHHQSMLLVCQVPACFGNHDACVIDEHIYGLIPV